MMHRLHRTAVVRRPVVPRGATPQLRKWASAAASAPGKGKLEELAMPGQTHTKQPSMSVAQPRQKVCRHG